jgi:hypothetical protein
MANEVDDEKREACRCGKPGDELHPCPFAADIHNDSETLCNCCHECERNCADDI